jgi:hypothetical protein
MEQERCLGLVDQGSDVADVDRLAQINKFAIVSQAIEELAEVFLHYWASAGGVVRAAALSY